jgi:hypothetical protein
MNVRRISLFVVFCFLITGVILADGPYGNYSHRKRGIMDGNLVVTQFHNYGMIGNWPSQPSGVWPKGTNHSYLDGVALIVMATGPDVVNSDGDRIHLMATQYREEMGQDYDDETGRFWGWEPLPDYANNRQDEPAMSDDADTWPYTWPDRPFSWDGFWNGYFGKGIQNADLETYFVMDDANDYEFDFRADTTDSVRGGMGLKTSVRGFQWNHVLAEDCIFWHYDIKNVSTTEYDSTIFGMLIDWGVGGTNNSADDAGMFDTNLDIAYAWDGDGFGDYGWSPVGVAGYAFLESPGNGTDGIDNDEDGMLDERRDDDIDNDGDWRSFHDRNENGIWDPEEPLNDDVGADGTGPNDPSYTGPDIGEGDGTPTHGEPNFDELDKDESDQIGLTAFHIFALHEYGLYNEEENWRLGGELNPPTDEQLEGVNLGMMFFSGTFPLDKDLTERFSMSLLYGNDLDDLVRNKKTVQAIYNANYNFAQPPLVPTVTAVAGDKKVTLLWDSVAEGSYDRFLQEYDFEGYRIYRSTDPSFIDSKIITDSYGNPTYRKPLAQFDLKDGRQGPHPVGVYGAHFDMGTESGLRHTFVDEDVLNGISYYYAVVSYDYGYIEGITMIDTVVSSVGEDSLTFQFVPELDANGNIIGIAPTECTSIIIGEVGGNAQLSNNTTMMTPNAPAAGYSPAKLDGGLRHTSGNATGQVTVTPILADSLIDGKTYQLKFIEAETYGNFLNLPQTYLIVDSTSGDTIQQGGADLYGYWGPLEPTDPSLWQSGGRAKYFRAHPDSTEYWHQAEIFVETDVMDGFAVTFNSDLINYKNVEDTGLDSVYWSGTYNPLYYQLYVDFHPMLNSLSLKVPYNYEVRFYDEIVDTSAFVLGIPATPVNFQVWNTTLNEKVDFMFQSRWGYVDNDHNGVPEDSVLATLFIVPKIINDNSPNSLIFSWAFRFDIPETAYDVNIVGMDTTVTLHHNEIFPGDGDLIKTWAPIPFSENDVYTFTMLQETMSNDQAKADLDKIAVVPNPYVSTEIWEPNLGYGTGRGQRKIDFIHLPQRCTIRIYTMSGYLVKEIDHNAPAVDGAESWNLISKDGMDIAYGVYIFHIDAPGIGEQTGKFAIIK